MARYAYAPLSVDENPRKRKSNTHDEDSSERHDQLVNERMPMCVGICVLMAIVYVLSRTGPTTLHDDPNIPAINTTALLEVSNSNTTGRVSSLDISRYCPKVEPLICPNSPPDESLNCVGLVDPKDIDMGMLRQQALANTPPHILECNAASDGTSQSACHLPSHTRFAALQQKGATLWMTGCSGAGKTTIATLLEETLVKLHGKHVYRLDGDNLRTGINRDLTFTEADRAESVRRTGEMAALFSDAGIITLVGLISPYRVDRDAVRKRHEEQHIPFYEIFLDVPIEELKRRDPKGQYARVESGQLKHFTCIDDPYEAPLQPDLTLKTHLMSREESTEKVFRMLQNEGILEGAQQLTRGFPNPDGDILVDRHVSPEEHSYKQIEASALPKVLINDIDLNWLQVIGEGWASPLKGFMREGTLLQTLHFNSILVDPFNLTGNILQHETQTNFQQFPQVQAPERVSMSVPITLAITDYTKTAIEQSMTNHAVALVTQLGQTVAILRDPEIYSNRKEEIIARLYGVDDPGHPYIQHINQGGDYLLGGEVELLQRILYNDGLDPWRKTPQELMKEFQDKGADTVLVFQTRNPTHAGHAYLMNKARNDLQLNHGFQKPILWLSPLGGWTKQDDVPLDVRVKQHEEVLQAGNITMTAHPGSLDPDTTVMAIWPAPMLYAGPTEVEFHAKSRRSAGASYFVVGRDPAGMKGSQFAASHPNDDLYDGNHGRYVLYNSPGIGDMKMLSFVKVMYDIRDNVMKVPDNDRLDDFISISGTKMRLLARNGAVPCNATTGIPTDLVQANCIPSGFMVPKGWERVVEYYKHINDRQRWIHWSRPIIDPPADVHTSYEGKLGRTSFQLKHTKYNSLWHDVPIRETADAKTPIVNLVTEIPMFMAAKMELQKEGINNYIGQDINTDGSPRFYTYGTPFFNYGFIPQTWEDPSLISKEGNGGDNDPLDVMEIGSSRLMMGSITLCKVLGSLELIDEGETDHKIICIATSDPDASIIHTMDDLELVKPGMTNRLIDWLKRYKTSDGKSLNHFSQETPTSVDGALDVIAEAHSRWKFLCSQDSSTTILDEYGIKSFWLSSPGCRGQLA